MNDAASASAKRETSSPVTRREWLHWLPLLAYPLALLDGFAFPWRSSFQDSLWAAAPMTLCCFSPVGLGMLVSMGLLLRAYARGAKVYSLLGAVSLWFMVEVGVLWIFARAAIRYMAATEHVLDVAQRAELRSHVIDETLHTNLTLAVALTIFGLVAIVNAVQLQSKLPPRMAR